MSNMLASVWVDESADSNIMVVTVAIDGEETRVYTMERNLWESVEQGLRDGSTLAQYLSPGVENVHVQAAEGTIPTKETLDEGGTR